jgi:hypothetical protein
VACLLLCVCSAFHISEDVFAGYNAVQRSGSVKFKEYISVGKGRDMGFDSINGFESKASVWNLCLACVCGLHKKVCAQHKLRHRRPAREGRRHGPRGACMWRAAVRTGMRVAPRRPSPPTSPYPPNPTALTPFTLPHLPTMASQVSGGNGEQVMSRDVHRLCTQFDFFRLMAFYHSGAPACFTALLSVYPARLPALTLSCWPACLPACLPAF